MDKKRREKLNNTITVKKEQILSYEQHGNLALIETQNWLYIKPIDWQSWENELQEIEDFTPFQQEMEILANSQFSPCCNGWDFVNPKVINALTEGIILSKEVTEDENGEIIAVGRIFWQEDYAIRSLIDQINQWGYAALVAC